MVTAPPHHELLIRTETESDYAAITDVHLQAFPKPEEAALVKKLRQARLFTPEMSLVASFETRIVGHVLFSQIEVSQGDTKLKALALAPVAVVPRFQGKGIGSQLIRAGLKEMTRLGFEVVLVLGEPVYYSRFGFRLESGRRIESLYSGANFMALELKKDALGDKLDWKATYSEPFKEI
jgi:putative acetyltransferase